MTSASRLPSAVSSRSRPSGCSPSVASTSMTARLKLRRHGRRRRSPPRRRAVPAAGGATPAGRQDRPVPRRGHGRPAGRVPGDAGPPLGDRQPGRRGRRRRLRCRATRPRPGPARRATDADHPTCVDLRPGRQPAGYSERGQLPVQVSGVTPMLEPLPVQASGHCLQVRLTVLSFATRSMSPVVVSYVPLKSERSLPVKVILSVELSYDQMPEPPPPVR